MNSSRALIPVLTTSAGLAVAVDQLTKSIIRLNLAVCSGPPVELCDRVAIAGPLGLIRTENWDGALGLLAGDAIGPVLIALIGLAVLWALRLPRTAGLAAATGLVIGGIAANLVDRFLFGPVTDFIDVSVGSGGIVLNPADVALAAGGAMIGRLLLQSTRTPLPAPPTEMGTPPGLG
jgi:signal peptidase II